MERIIDIDGDAGHITRGGLAHDVYCRVSCQSGGVWDYQTGGAGADITTAPYALAEHDADIEEGDILAWRDRRFQVGAVSRPTIGGGAACLQARLKEMQA
jgi:hypothetical protein